MAMNKKDLRIVYMGTPEFAVAPLKTLVESGYNVVGVITVPDRQAGRGMKLQSSPVKQYALSVNIPVLQPEKLKDEAFLEELKSFKADLQVVVAFRMLPEVVWAMPVFGTFNLHASLLPQYRGAAPIHHAVMNGDKQTGVTTFFLQHEIDTGDVIFREKIDIADDEDTGSVHDRLMLLGCDVVRKTVDAVLSGDIKSLPQSDIEPGLQLKPANKLTRENTRIDWSNEGIKIYNFIRGLSPYPAAWTELVSEGGENIGLKIFKSVFVEEGHECNYGDIVSDCKRYIKVAVRGGFVEILRLQPAGKKAMDTDEFLRGFKNIEKFRLV